MRAANISILFAIASTFALLAGSAAAAAIVNPGFESGTTGWTVTTDTGFFADTDSAVSQGSSSGRLFNHNNRTVLPSTFGEFSQAVDMTELTEITFDLAIRYNGTGNAWDAAAFLASATIDGVDEVTFNTTNTYLGVSLDVSSLSGMHDLGFRLTSLITTVGTGAGGPGVVTHQIRVDNIQTVPEPSRALLALLGLGAVLAGRRRG